MNEQNHDDPELNQLRADAARYRWLRGGAASYSTRWMRWNIEIWRGYWHPLRGEEMDAEIDDAMTREGVPG